MGHSQSTAKGGGSSSSSKADKKGAKKLDAKRQQFVDEGADMQHNSQRHLNAGVAERGRNLFVTLLDSRDDQAHRKQADDRRTVERLGSSYRVPASFINKYEWGELVGSGGYSYVQKARDKSTGELVAVKCIRKEPMDYQLCEQIEQEVELQRLCKHKHVVEVLDFVDTKSMYFIVMKLLNGGDLLATIVGETREVAYSERTAADTVKAMACALAHIHAQGIAHLDVKPDNILYDNEGVLKLADFGMAARTPVDRDTGTPLFVAPEILIHQRCGTAADIFSLGVVTYILLCGFAPFVEARSLDELSHAIKHGRWDFYSPYWDHISKEARDLIRRMLSLDPTKRPTAQEVMDDVWIRTASTSAMPASAAKRVASFAVKKEFRKRVDRLQMIMRMQKRHKRQDIITGRASGSAQMKESMAGKAASFHVGATRTAPLSNAGRSSLSGIDELGLGGGAGGGAGTRADAIAEVIEDPTSPLLRSSGSGGGGAAMTTSFRSIGDSDSEIDEDVHQAADADITGDTTTKPASGGGGGGIGERRRVRVGAILSTPTTGVAGAESRPPAPLLPARARAADGAASVSSTDTNGSGSRHSPHVARAVRLASSRRKQKRAKVRQTAAATESQHASPPRPPQSRMAELDALF